MDKSVDQPNEKRAHISSHGSRGEMGENGGKKAKNQAKLKHKTIWIVWLPGGRHIHHIVTVLLSTFPRGPCVVSHVIECCCKSFARLTSRKREEDYVTCHISRCSVWVFPLTCFCSWSILQAVWTMPSFPSCFLFANKHRKYSQQRLARTNHRQYLDPVGRPRVCGNWPFVEQYRYVPPPLVVKHHGRETIFGDHEMKQRIERDVINEWLAVQSDARAWRRHQHGIEAYGTWLLHRLVVLGNKNKSAVHCYSPGGARWPRW